MWRPTERKLDSLCDLELSLHPWHVTSDFQGQILKKLYLRNDWHETKVMGVRYNVASTIQP